jgi:hypothetical protein
VHNFQTDKPLKWACRQKTLLFYLLFLPYSF